MLQLLTVSISPYHFFTNQKDIFLVRVTLISNLRGEVTVGNSKSFQRFASGETSPTQHNQKGNAQLQSRITNEIKNISDSIEIIKDTMFDGIDELTRIESELNEIKRKQGFLEPKGAKTHGKR